MKLFSKFDKIFFISNFVFTFLMTKFHLNAYFSFSIFLTIYLLHVILVPKRIMLYSFLFFPLIFILKGPDSSNLLLISFPEVLALISIVYSFFFKHKLAKPFNKTKTFYLLVFHIILTFLISFFHILDFSYLFIIFRQYTLPLLFLLSIISYSQFDEKFIYQSLFITILSFAFVALMAIMNLLNLINFVSDLPELQPVLTILSDSNSLTPERDSIFMISIPRLNLLTGGALGSSAAVFILLALLIMFNKNIFHINSFKYTLIFIFVISALMTSSVSIITPLLVLFILFFLFKFKIVYKTLLIIIIILISIIALNYYNFNPFVYFIDVFLVGYIGFFKSISLFDFIFGVGPRITTVGFNYINENKFLIDIGIFRVFVESGIINFLIFIMFLSSFFIKSLKILNNNFSKNSLIYILIFFTFCLLVHANFSLLPPFYPLFGLSIVGILINYNKIRNIYVKK
jgi:hypothetical protein